MIYVVNNNPHMVDVPFVDQAGERHEVAVMPKSRLPVKQADWKPVDLPAQVSVIDDQPVGE